MIDLKTSGMIVIAMIGKETERSAMTIAIAIDRETIAGRETGTETQGCTGMCRVCRMGGLAGSIRLRMVLTERVCSVRGQIVRLLKEF